MPRSTHAPTYRFRGSVAPREGIRTPVLDQLTAIDEGDGTATLRIYDPIDSWGGDWGVSAKEVAAALDQLPADLTGIRLHINSPGGEVYEGIAIMNMLRRHKAKVTAVVDGIAASAASFIACSADETVMAPNSQLMIHDAWGICIGNAETMRETGDLLDKISNNIADVYARKAGGEVEAWRTLMLEETWYDAAEAVAAGLADQVEEKAADSEKPKASFDLSVFQYAGRDDAPPPPTTLPAPSVPASLPEDNTAAAGTPTADRRQQLRRKKLHSRAG